jgi:carbamoyl-phosphate synthase small subunit
MYLFDRFRDMVLAIDNGEPQTEIHSIIDGKNQ